MSEAQALLGAGEASPSEVVARKVRGRMAEEQISGRKMAVLIGLDQRAFSRRHRGEVAWSIDELAAIAGVLRIQLMDLVADVRVEVSERPAAPGGGRAFFKMPARSLCAIRDLNPEPADTGATSPAVVTPFRRPLPQSLPAPAASHTSVSRPRLRLVEEAS